MGNASLDQRGHIPENRGAALAGGCQRFNASRLDHRRHARQRIEHHLDLTADDVVARACAAFVGNVLDVGAGHVFE